MTTTRSISCVVLGGGGHAKVVVDALGLRPGIDIAGIIDNDLALKGQRLASLAILGDDSLLPSLRSSGITHFIVGVGSIGDSARREQLFDLGVGADLAPLSVDHPRAIIAADSIFGAGVFVAAGAIVNPGAEIGDNAIINTGAIVEHDAKVGAHAHIAPGAVLGGDVIIGRSAHVGIGATVRQGIRIGTRSLVGAGAVVVADVPADTTVIGVPAKPIGDQKKS